MNPPLSFADYAHEMMPSLVRSARAVAGEATLADDVLQAVLERVCRDWRKIGGLENRNAYVKRMIVNEFLDQVRHRQRWPIAAEPQAVAQASDAYAHRDEQDALLDEIRQLPPQQRVAIGLRFYADLSDDEIADAMGCRPGTVRGYLSRALATLRVTYAITHLTDLEHQEN